MKTLVHNWNGRVLRLHNIPPKLVPEIQEYNQTQKGPDSTPIDITKICVDALQELLDSKKEDQKEDEKDKKDQKVDQKDKDKDKDKN